MGEVIRFIPKSELERARLIERPARHTNAYSRRLIRSASNGTPRNERLPRFAALRARLRFGPALNTQDIRPSRACRVNQSAAKVGEVAFSGVSTSSAQRFFIPKEICWANRFSHSRNGFNGDRRCALNRARWRLIYRFDRVCIWHRSKIFPGTLSIRSSSPGHASHLVFRVADGEHDRRSQ